MDLEMMRIQIAHDFEELAEQYDGAADNEQIFALGAPTMEATKMHLMNVVQNREMAKFYRYLATRPLDLIECFEEDKE